jgi:hypothetical protein
MAELNKQDLINDQYYISTTTNDADDKKFLSVVYGYHNKTVMWCKVYKKVQYTTLKEAEEGHKKLKQEFS